LQAVLQISTPGVIGDDWKSSSCYVGLYAMGNDADNKAKAQSHATKQVIKDIQNLTVKPPLKNTLLALIHGPCVKLLKNKEKGFNVNLTCNGCSTCSKVCPVGNIKIIDGKLIFLHHREQ
jgi:ferredoxin